MTASSGAGFVAVLSSQKSRMDALKIFANMQEKYGNVLSSRTPDVQEANLGEKGVWYRLVVGPPGSRDAAAGAVHPAQDRRLRRLLGDGVLRAICGSCRRACRACSMRCSEART